MMKNTFCAALILFAAIGAFAQERTISKTEFDAVYNSPTKAAPVVWHGKTWRMIITTETKAVGNDAVDASTKSVSEFAPKLKSHTISETRMGSEVKKSERIRIGDKLYKRGENGVWTAEAFEQNAKTETTGQETSPSAEKQSKWQFEYKYLGSENLNDQPTKVYVKLMKNTGGASSTDPKRMSVETTTKYWFNEEGTLIKEEKIIEGRNKTDSLFNRVTMIYELDSNIKIEAPVIN